MPATGMRSRAVFWLGVTMPIERFEGIALRLLTLGASSDQSAAQQHVDRRAT
jgi:hypothetical protein